MNKPITIKMGWTGAPPLPGDHGRITGGGGAPDQIVVIEHVRRLAVSGSHQQRLTVTCRPVDPHALNGHLVHELRAPPRPRTIATSRPTADPGPPESSAARLARLRARAPLLVGQAEAAVIRSQQTADTELLHRLSRLRSDDAESADAAISPVVKLVPSAQRRNGRVTKGEWASPTAGTASWKRRDTITGFRRTDPIAALHSRNNLVTDAHTKAADRYRLCWEMGPGASHAGRDSTDMSPRATHTGPGGPTDKALSAMRRWLDVQARFDCFGQAMLKSIVLDCNDVSAWAKRNEWNRHHATGYLLALLDRLVAHYGPDEEDTL